MAYGRFLLARDVAKEQEDIRERQREAEQQNRRAGIGSALGKFMGGMGLPALLAATGVGAPLAVVAGLGSFAGSKLGEAAGGGYYDESFEGGKFLTPQRTDLTQGFQDYAKSAHQAQNLGAVMDAAMMGFGGAEGLRDWAGDFDRGSFFGKMQERGDQSLWDYIMSLR